jgi:hypothetical protein
MKNYRLDPKNPRRLTDEEARRLDEIPIDYSDIPLLSDEFFSRAVHPQQPADPWLEAMLYDVYDRLGAMTKARGDGEFSAEEEARYWALVRELTEIDHAMYEAGADPWFPRPPAMPKERLTAAHIENVKPGRRGP